MSKVGRVMNDVAGAAVKASGMATKYGGEAVAGIGKKMGLSKDKCDQVEQSSDRIGKDLYFASENIGRKAEQITDDVVDASKRVYQSVKDRIQG